MSTEPLTDVRQISDIAYGFLASKTLFAALNIDLFGGLNSGSKSVDELAEDTAVPPHRLLTLLTACAGLGLITRDGDRFSNSPAAQTYLVRSAPAYFGDYFRFQIDRQVYPLMLQLDQAMRGEAPGHLYQQMLDPEEADYFSRAQHAGSLGPALVLQKVVDLSGAHRLLDVAGGSGAFTITLCRRYPDLTATIVDFPAVIEVAKRYVKEAGLASRVEYLGGNALNTAWPENQDVVLMSYLLSGVAADAWSHLLAQAYQALVPGGMLLVHDFMVDDDRTGPRNAALWFMTFVFDPKAASFAPTELVALAERAGFVGAAVQHLIPGITRLLVARKPASLASPFSVR